MYLNNNILTLPRNIEQLIYCVRKKMEGKKNPCRLHNLIQTKMQQFLLYSTIETFFPSKMYGLFSKQIR